MNEVLQKLYALVVVGAGNIGSSLLGLLPGTPHVHRMAVVDSDRYELKNTQSQMISPADVGKSKAKVQTKRLATHPQFEVDAWPCRIEEIPLEFLRGSIIIACVDSFATRQYINRVAWRLGLPAWIDAGVHWSPDEQLARVNVYIPGPEMPCVECGWTATHYENLEQVYPCQGMENAPAPTNAPRALGALAAGLQVLELNRFLDGSDGETHGGVRFSVDMRSRQSTQTRLHRNKHCRFDHATWAIEPLNVVPSDVSVNELMATLARRRNGTIDRVRISLEGQQFVHALRCITGCSQKQISVRLSGRLRPRDRICRECGETMFAGGLDVTDAITNTTGGKTLRRSMSALGFLPGDVFTITSAGEAPRHYCFPIERAPRSCGEATLTDSKQPAAGETCSETRNTVENSDASQ